MENSLEILQQINWFLKPVSDFLIFMVGTTVGRVIMLLLFLFYFFITYMHSINQRKALGKGSSSYGTGFVPFQTKIYFFFRDLFAPLLKMIVHLPVVLGVIVTLGLLVGVSSALQNMQAFAENQKEIEQLGTIVKQLDKRYKVASIKVEKTDYVNKTTSLEIEYFGNSLQSPSENKQNIIIQGFDIYFDAMVLNFEYSAIQDGDKHNLVLPYRIFSEVVAAKDGIKLNYFDNDSIPLIYKREASEIYGLSAEDYNARMDDFTRLIFDEDYARKMGVRSFQGNAVHKRLAEGKIYDIWIEQTGGLVLKQATLF
ncbi:MAG: hypothetical protein KAI79_13060 [Bacteroidales bacterium]|nr:hypothetical protein [Bacteroidales bacterium]